MKMRFDDRLNLANYCLGVSNPKLRCADRKNEDGKPVFDCESFLLREWARLFDQPYRPCP
jgi:hypothetical protein